MLPRQHPHPVYRRVNYITVNYIYAQANTGPEYSAEIVCRGFSPENTFRMFLTAYD